MECTFQPSAIKPVVRPEVAAALPALTAGLGLPDQDSSFGLPYSMLAHRCAHKRPNLITAPGS